MIPIIAYRLIVTITGWGVHLIYTYIHIYIYLHIYTCISLFSLLRLDSDAVQGSFHVRLEGVRFIKYAFEGLGLGLRV